MCVCVCVCACVRVCVCVHVLMYIVGKQTVCAKKSNDDCS